MFLTGFEMHSRRFIGAVEVSEGGFSQYKVIMTYSELP